MLNFIIRKLLGMIPMLLIITLLIYAGIELMPGDVIDFLIPMDQLAEISPSVTPSTEEITSAASDSSMVAGSFCSISALTGMLFCSE